MKDYTADEIVEIKANSKSSKLVLGFKRNPKHFNLLKAVITKLESMSGVTTKIPKDYKNKED